MNFPRIFSTLFRRRQVDAEMGEELRLHLELLADEYAAQGMNRSEAVRAARLSFGGVEQIKERCREQRAFAWLEQLWRDLLYAVRSLRKQPGFTFAAVLTLAIGIGINAHVFSIINDLIVRPAVRARTENFVAIRTHRVGGDRGYRAFSYEEYRAIRADRDIFVDVGAMQFVGALVGREGEAQRRFVSVVSPNYFEMFGLRPLRGRFFGAEEADPARDIPVLVASYELWQRMGGGADFVGSQIRIDQRDYTVIGIAPEGFGGLHWSIGPDAWLPLGVSRHLIGFWGLRPGGVLDSHSYILQVFGALAPGLSLDAARARLDSLVARLNHLAGAGDSEQRALTIDRPPHANWDLTWPTDESSMRIYAVAAMAMTLIVLFVACVNVANMLLGRGLARQKEIAIRLCLGASRGRVIRQLLVEGLVLALLGGAVGVALSGAAYAAMTNLARLHAGMVTMTLRFGFGWVPLLVTFALCLLATMVFAVTPAIRATRLNLVEDLKQQGGDPMPSGGWNRFLSLRHCLVMVQVALSVALLFSSGLLVHAVLNTERDRGFATDRRIIANLDYKLAQTPAAEVPRRQRTILDRVARIPGVESVTLASAVPFNFEPNIRRWYPVGAARAREESQGDGGSGGGLTLVGDGYFANLGITLLRGRDFTAAEAREGKGRPVAIIDESFGRALFGDRDPLGRHIVASKADLTDPVRTIEIVGIVRSPREDALQSSATFLRVYRPYGQVGDEFTNTYVHVRVMPGAPLPATAQAVRQELRTLDPETPILACEPLDEFLGKNLNTWSVTTLTMLFGVFGLVAVLLAVIGTYGVKAYQVKRRTREIGIRIAVGARPGNVLRLLLRQSVLQTAVGVALGTMLSIFAGMFLSKILYRVGAADAPALVSACVLVSLASIFACVIPAWRATAIKPMDALRTE